MNKLDLINMFAALFLSALKDGETKKKIRDVALKMHRSIKVAFAGDPDFE